MPPRNRTSSGPPRAPHPTKAQVAAAIEQSAEHLAAQQEPPTDVHPNATTPSNAEVEAAVEKSAEFLQTQQEPPSDVHPKPTTPSNAEVEAAVALSAEHLEAQGVTVDTSTAGAPSPAPRAAAPVAGGGPDAALAAAPASGGRDKTQDASPVFSAPISDKPA